jgi:hypothetical protein
MGLEVEAPFKFAVSDSQSTIWFNLDLQAHACWSVQDAAAGPWVLPVHWQGNQVSIIMIQLELHL